MADFGVFAKLDIARSCEHFWSRGLRQNVVRWLHFKRILIRRRWDLRRGVLGARDFDLLFGRFSLGPPYEEFQKLADFGVFAKLDIARSCEHFSSRGLRQNVVRWLHFKHILIRRGWELRRGVLGAREFDLLFGRFSLGPSYEEFQTMADFCVLAKLDIPRSCKHFWSCNLRQNVVPWLHFKRILIRRRWDLRRGILGAREFDLLFGRFSLGPPYEEFQKMADFGVFAKLDIARSCEHFWSRDLRQNVVRWLHFKRRLIKRRSDLRRGVLGAREFDLLFGRFFLGPPYEEFQKMADFGVFAKLDIARSCEHFWSRGLRQNVVRWLHFKQILIKRGWDLRRGVLGAREFDLLLGRFSLGPPYEEFQKMADFGVFAKLDIARSCEHFWNPGLRQNVVRWLYFKHILIKRQWDLRRGVLGAREFDLLFGRFSLGPPYKEFQKLADFAVFAKLDIARNCEHFWSRGLHQNVVRWLHFKRILITRGWKLRRDVFGARDFDLLFGRFSLAPSYEEFQTMADFFVLAKLDIARSCEHFWSRNLRQNVVRWLHFKHILIIGRWDLRRGILGAREFDLLFGRFSLGPPYEEFKKLADFGVFAKLDIARSCEHFWSRDLNQNVVRWLHFQRILIRRRWDLLRGVLGAREFGLLFGRFSLGPPYEEFQTMADFCVLSNLDIARSCEHFWSRNLRHNVVRWLHFKRILIRRRWDLRRGILGAREFDLLFRRFSLGPPYEEFQKMADVLVSLPNWT